MGQKKFLSEFLGNFSLAWIVGIIISPFISGNLLTDKAIFNLVIGTINAIWPFTLALFLTKEIRS